MEDSEEFREEFFSHLSDCDITRNTKSGLRYGISMDDEDDDEDLKHVRAFIIQRLEGEADAYSTVWHCRSDTARVLNNACRLKIMAHDTLCKLVKAVRETHECSRCTKRRRTIKDTERCMGCLLAPLEEEQQWVVC